MFSRRVVALCAGLMVSTLAFGIQIPDSPDSDLARKIQIHQPETLVLPVGDFHSYTDNFVWNEPAWSVFLGRHGSKWDIAMDHRGGRPDLIQGQGIPWLPGNGNSLTAKDMEAIGLKPTDAIDAHVFGMLAEAFMDDNPGLFRLDKSQLKLDVEGSYISERYSSIRFMQVVNGVPVRKSHVFFRINNGNLIQFGSYFIENVTISTTPDVTAETAFNKAVDYVEKHFPGRADPLTGIDLMILPVASEGAQFDSTEYKGVEGRGYTHRLVYRFEFRMETSDVIWEAMIDAHDGSIVVLQDSRKFASVDGGIYPVTNLDTEVVRPFPYAQLTNGSTKYTDAGGNYSYGSGTATITLNGQYVNVSDN